MPKRRRRFSRRHGFALLVLACLVVGLGFVTVTAVSGFTSSAGTAGRSAAAAKLLASGSSHNTPYLLYRDLSSPGELHAEVALTALDRPGARPTRAGLGCERVYFAAGHGLCLAFDADPIPGYRAKFFGPDFRVQHSIGLEGYPSRARVSPDGRYGAFTIFVAGHSYRASQFSTRTAILDMRTGRYFAKNLESFDVTRDGQPIRSRDFNFWGVTFADDSSKFYATLWTKGKTYLVAGDLRTRAMRVLRENAECPSLAPDGTRLVYKKRIGGDGAWRFYVLDLASGRETPLADTHARDDQVDWLDDRRVAYGSNGKIWAVPADGTGSPEVLVEHASSPSVVLPTGG